MKIIEVEDITKSFDKETTNSLMKEYCKMASVPYQYMGVINVKKSLTDEKEELKLAIDKQFKDDNHTILICKLYKKNSFKMNFSYYHVTIFHKTVTIENIKKVVKASKLKAFF